MFDRSKQRFAYDFLDSFGVVGERHLQRYVFNLNNKLSCQTLSNALEMSKKIPFTSTVGLSSKADCISFIMVVVGNYMSLLEENLIEKA